MVDIHNRPYQSMVLAAAALDCASLKSASYSGRPDASQGVPPAPREPLSQFEPTLALKAWDRERGFVKPISSYPMADLYVCWTPAAIYLGLYAQDAVEVACYRDKKVPESDRAEWVVQAGEAGQTIRARIGAGAKLVINDPAVRANHLSGIELNTRCIAAMELPASHFGRTRFRSGDRIEFASTFHTHCRAYRVEWRGKFTLQSLR